MISFIQQRMLPRLCTLDHVDSNGFILQCKSTMIYSVWGVPKFDECGVRVHLQSASKSYLGLLCESTLLGNQHISFIMQGLRQRLAGQGTQVG